MFYVRITRRDGGELGIAVRTAERVAELVDTLRPRMVCLNVGPDEDHGTLLAQIVGRPAALH